MKRVRWIVVVVAIAALFGIRWWLHRGGSGHAMAAPAAPPVSVARVIVRTVAERHVYTGRLQAVDSVQVRPRVGGYVESVHFREGAMVHKGQLLFQIDPRPYQDEVDRLQASLADAHAALALARANARRGRRLVSHGFISQQNHDQLTTAVRSAEAQVASIEASLKRAQLDLSFTQVRAPINGRVSNVRITPGNLVTSKDVLTDVVSVDPLYAYFNVDEPTYLGLLDRGEANARGDAAVDHAVIAMGLANESGFPHRGRVDFVDNRVDASDGTIRLRAVFGNTDGNLVPGLFARLRLRSSAPRPTVLIDDRAVGTDLSNRFVYVVDGHGKAQYRKVKLGAMYDGLRIVDHGLKAGERVVVNGLQRVRPGNPVTPQKVAMDAHLSAHDRALVEQGGGGAAGAAAGAAEQD